VVVPVSSEAAAIHPPIERPSPAQLLEEIVEPVAADMDTMNQNLRHIVGDRHPMLLAAADQIFGAGGKKLRPMVVLLMARATAEMAGLRCGRGRRLLGLVGGNFCQEAKAAP
jgi:all-trans-nonaprenyl-diphosphate synthase